MEEILQRGQQKRAEFTLRPLRTGVNLVLDEMGEESLGQVLRVVDRVAAAADESIQGCPVGPAKLGRGGLGGLGRRRFLARRQDNALPIHPRTQTTVASS